MPLLYEVENDGNVLINYWYGPVSRDDLLNNTRFQMNDERIKRDAVVLTDALDADFTAIDNKTIMELSQIYNDPRNKTRTSKAALLMPTAFMDKAKQFERECDLQGRKVLTFYALDVACTWLGIDLTVTIGVLEKLRTHASTVL